jgi:hypothetical protein
MSRRTNTPKHGPPRRKRPLPTPQNIANIYVDYEIKRVVVITKDILLNQLRREMPLIAASFDEITIDELQQVSELIAATYGILSPRLIGRDLTDQNLAPTCARLLYSAATTFTGCVQLARSGFPRQYMMLNRSVVETVSSVLRLTIDAKALREFYNGKFNSSKTIHAAKQVLPVFGPLYGMLSNQFVHIGEGHSQIEKIGRYSKDDEALSVILINMKITAWLIYVATELVFRASVPAPRYWKVLTRHPEGDEVMYAPSEAEKEWQAGFFGWSAENPEY